MPLSTWTAQTSAAADDWVGVCWSVTKQLFVAVAFVSHAVQTSPDGKVWTLRTGGSAENWRDVLFHDAAGLFIAVGAPAVTSNWQTSPDGITWTTHTPEICAGTDVREIAYNPTAGRALAIGGVSSLSWTTNGTAWTSFTLSNPTANTLSNIEWDATHSVWVLTDNVDTTWHSADPPTAGSWTKVVANALKPDNDGIGTGALCISPSGIAVIVGQQTIGGARCQRSSDGGATWALETNLAIDTTWQACAWDSDDNVFFAVGTGGANNIAVSPDGITWTPASAPNAVIYTCAAYAPAPVSIAVVLAKNGLVSQQGATSPGATGGAAHSNLSGFKYWW